MKRRDHQNLPHIPYLNHHDTQDIKTRKGPAKLRIIFCPRAANTEHDIAHNTKTQTIQELTNIVSIKPLDILCIRAYFRSRSNGFKAGKLKHYLHKWKEFTSDKEILQTVSGFKLELLGDPPVKHNSCIPQFLKEDESAVDLEIKKLSAKGVIAKFEHETVEYISQIL